MTETYQIKFSPPPISDPRNYGDIKAIRAMLDATDAGRIEDAGRAYKAASRHAEMLQVLLRNAERGMGRALDGYGGEVLPWYVANKPSAGFWTTDRDNDDAHRHLRKLNHHIVKTWDNLPSDVREEPARPRRSAKTMLASRGMPSGARADRAAPNSPGVPTGPGPGGGPWAPESGGAAGVTEAFSGRGGAWVTAPPVGPAAGDMRTDLSGLGAVAGAGSLGGSGGAAAAGPGGTGCPSPGGSFGAARSPGAARMVAPGTRPPGAPPGLRTGSSDPARTKPNSKPPSGPDPSTGEPSEAEHPREYWLPEDRETWAGGSGVAAVIGGRSAAGSVGRDVGDGFTGPANTVVREGTLTFRSVAQVASADPHPPAAACACEAGVRTG